MKLRTVLTGAALAAGASLAIASQASAASLVICDAPACGTADPGVTFSTNDFEGTFQLNSVVVQSGLGNPNSTTASELSAASANPAENDFRGVWILGGPIAPQNETIFFTEGPAGGISDVLHFVYSEDSLGHGHLDGFVISDVKSGIDPAFLAGRGIFATQTRPEGLFRFDNTNITASFQSDIPEPATWAMLLLGFGGLGATLRVRRSARSATA